MPFTVKHTTQYPGGHATDPGYRTTTVVNAKGDREYNFHSAPDGSEVRYVGTRPAGKPSSFRRVARSQEVKHAPELEAAIKAHLQA